MRRINPIIWIILLLMLATIVSAPPTTVNARGTIYHNNGNYATGGFPVSLNNTNTSDFVRTRTNGQAAPHIDASYANTFNGSSGDTLIVFAWNTTHYGTNTSIVTTPTTRTNIIINTTRPSEINLTLTTPSNNTLLNISTIFTLNATLFALGGIDATGCNATLSINNNKIILIGSDTLIHNVGDITLGTSIETTWNLTGNLTGSSNLSVIAICDSDGIRFDKQNEKSINNITIVDQVPPVINLEYYFNNTKIKQPGTDIHFFYNVSDSTNVTNCSLIINNILNQSNNTIIEDTSLNFSTPLGNSDYTWYVNCTDEHNNTGYSGFFTLNITPNYIPYVTNMQIPYTIDLNSGSTKLIHCNATITDDNGIDDLSIINTTFFIPPILSNSDDDNNNHYSNTSCSIISQTDYTADYSCSHSLEYYANPGNWTCNMSVMDNSSTYNSSNISSTINELIAIEVSPSIIDYGDLEAGTNSISDFIVNITNYGNTLFNITIDGFAQSNGDNLAMNCTNGNIDISYEKYSIYPGTTYSAMIELTDTSTLIKNLTFPPRTNDTTYKNDRNYTYWKMGIPLAIQGSCSGFVVFKTTT